MNLNNKTQLSDIFWFINPLQEQIIGKTHKLLNKKSEIDINTKINDDIKNILNKLADTNPDYKNKLMKLSNTFKERININKDNIDDQINKLFKKITTEIYNII